MLATTAPVAQENSDFPTERDDDPIDGGENAAISEHEHSA